MWNCINFRYTIETVWKFIDWKTSSIIHRWNTFTLRFHRIESAWWVWLLNKILSNTKWAWLNKLLVSFWFNSNQVIECHIFSSFLILFYQIKFHLSIHFSQDTSVFNKIFDFLLHFFKMLIFQYTIHIFPQNFIISSAKYRLLFCLSIL